MNIGPTKSPENNGIPSRITTPIANIARSLLPSVAESELPAGNVVILDNHGTSSFSFGRMTDNTSEDAAAAPANAKNTNDGGGVSSGNGSGGIASGTTASVDGGNSNQQQQQNADDLQLLSCGLDVRCS